MRDPMLSFALLALLLLPLSGVVHAESLLTLQSGQAVGVVQDGIGIVAAPMAGMAEPAWLVIPGTNRYQSNPPVDRRVDLFHAVNGHLVRVAAIRIRYYWSAAAGWTPRYRMSEQMYFVSTPSGWRPLAMIGGAPSMMDYTGTGGANAQGYYGSLQFRSVAGPITIDAWSVTRLVPLP